MSSTARREGGRARPEALPEVLLAELERAADRRGVRVSYEALQASLGAGGLCRVKGQLRLIIDKRASTSDRVAMLAQAIAHRGGGDDGELSPAARDLVALHVARRAS
jgi:hypothetical protein